MRRVPGPLPAGQAAALQSLPLTYCRACIEELAKRSRGAALCLPRVSQGGHSTPRRRGGAAGRVLCGENERSVRKNGEGGGEGGGDVRAVRGSKVGRVLSSVRRVHLQRLRVLTRK